ncbi:methyl-accepting chemotaxis protein [Pseudomonas chengduensis]|nr:MULTISPECIES: methyl-accepting chemotaxis protein [Pseudomonas]MDH0625711.1 methyl-accepting chemotaxis protein [Pseudomonas chengduensis]MDH1214230.1 methyl-accepting chemotaxis protein [Pseudomonas chengduensis]MDH1283483.1 methyl-accepting chemotaxis protein [Pseudomonas chengduensis]MDH1668437.1 methyl-accepting chemotaxis protein [Pseudomonas chengduensis]TRO28791.1 methyl-accepting chemotaxis protein [Pseudomonas sp. ALS1279]
MTGVLKPGVRLLQRFSFAHKFQLVFLLFALPLGYALWVISSDYLSRLQSVDFEVEGAQALERMAQVQHELIAQRTLLARWKGTENAAQGLLQQREARLDEALQQAAEPLQSELISDQARQHFQALQGERDGLRAAGLTKVPLPDALERYQKALLSLIALREQVATDSTLILDPRLDTYLMMEQITYIMPRLLEQLGTFAAQGHGAVVSQHFTLQSRVLIRDLRRSLDEQRAQLVKAQITLSREAPQAMRQLSAPFDASLKAFDDFLTQIDRDMFEASPMALTPEQFVQRVEALESQLQALQQALYQQFSASLGHYRQQALHSMIEVIGAFIVLTLLAMYVLICLNASIRISTSNIIEAARGLRDGDLRVRMEVNGRDDLAAIAQALNTAVEQMRDSLQGVNRESQQLDSTVQLLGGQARDALDAVEQQQAQMSQIATAATQMAATAQSVAQSCEQAAVEAQQTREVALSSNQRSERTSASMRHLSSRLGDSAAALQQLRDQTQQINRVVEVIKGIAEQTNLLALNAAIEAARAGEAGRGFAVVADEVRSLSKRTQDSTQEIAQTVDNLQRVVGQSVTLMEEACSQADGDIGSVLAMGDELQNIVDSVQRVSDRLAQIATAAEQQAATADEVSGNIQQVDQAAGQLLDGAQAVSSAAEQLRRGSEGLAQNTGRFSLE